MNRFFDSATRPPKHGWHFPINGQVVAASSESAIHAAISKWQRNNGQFISDQAITAAMWSYYCSREPERCGMESAPAATGLPTGPLVRANVTPELQGPPIWLFLNTLAVQWTAGMHGYFLATCDVIVNILECPICRDEWRKILADRPPAGLTSKLAVCDWVNTAHNLVNARTGKQQFPYAEMVRKFGAPMP